MNTLGGMLIHGVGVAKNPEEGFRWTLKSAEAGYPLGMYSMVEIYTEGQGTEVDLEKAEYWRQKALETGVDFSQYAQIEDYAENRSLPSLHESADGTKQ